MKNWEEEFDKKFAFIVEDMPIMSKIKSSIGGKNETFELDDIKDFIVEVEQEAEQRGYDRAKKMALDSIDKYFNKS